MNGNAKLITTYETDRRTRKQLERYELLLSKLSDKELKERYHKLKPIAEYLDAYYYLRKYKLSELKHDSFLYSLPDDIRTQVDIEIYEPIDEFNCYHTYGRANIFKPTIAEILTQFPTELIKESDAFVMTDYPHFYEEIDTNSKLFKAGYHESTIRALRLKKN